MVSVICVVITFLAGISRAEDGLSFKFQPGDKYFLVSASEQKTTRVVDGNVQVTERTVRLGCDLDIEEVEENGCAWARHTYRRVAMKVKGPGVDIDFDTDVNQQESRRAGAQISPLALALGESFYAKISPQGRIDKINGLQAIVSAARGKIAGPGGVDRLMQAINNQFDEDLVRRELEGQLAVFPDACSSSADQWSRKERLTEQAVVLEWTWRLRSRLNGVAFIDVNLVILPSVADIQEAVEDDVKTRREVSGQGTGQIEIEEATGRIIRSGLTEDLLEEVRLSAQGLMLRPPPAPEPARTHAVTTFQMVRREDPNNKSETPNKSQ